MFGIQDPWIWLPYLLCILSTLLCVIYGLLNWNRGQEEAVTPQDIEWAEEEEKIGDEL